MATPIGIITKDPLVGAAIYRAMLEERERQMCDKLKSSAPKHFPSTYLYSPKLSQKRISPAFELYEGTGVMRKLDAGFVAFPEMKLDELKNAPSQRKVLKPPFPQTNIPEKLRSYFLKGESPKQGDANYAQYERVKHNIEEWAHFLLDASRHPEKVDKDWVMPVNKSLPDKEEVELASSQVRHRGGYIAIHGGMGPEAGVLSFLYAAEKHKGSLLLASPSVAHTGPEYIVQTLTDGYSDYLNPVPGMQEVRRKMAATKPDIAYMACNTMSYFRDKLREGVDMPVINIIEEGLKKIPDGSKVLLLSTRASIKAGLFPKAIEKLGKDIELVLPEEKDQERINEAIFGHILADGNIDFAAKEIKEVLKKYDTQLGPDGHILVGCTEIKIGLTKANVKPQHPLFDTDLVAADMAAQIAAEKSRLRDQKLVIPKSKTRENNKLAV